MVRQGGSAPQLTGCRSSISVSNPFSLALRCPCIEAGSLSRRIIILLFIHVKTFVQKRRVVLVTDCATSVLTHSKRIDEACSPGVDRHHARKKTAVVRRSKPASRASSRCIFLRARHPPKSGCNGIRARTAIRVAISSRTLSAAMVFFDAFGKAPFDAGLTPKLIHALQYAPPYARSSSCLQRPRPHFSGQPFRRSRTVTSTGCACRSRERLSDRNTLILLESMHTADGAKFTIAKPLCRHDGCVANFHSDSVAALRNSMCPSSKIAAHVSIRDPFRGHAQTRGYIHGRPSEIARRMSSVEPPACKQYSYNGSFTKDSLRHAPLPDH